MAPGRILFDGGEAEVSDWNDYGLADIQAGHTQNGAVANAAAKRAASVPSRT